MKYFYKKFGFTLVELMLVIAIIGILAVVLYPQLTGYFERADDKRKIAELNQIQLAIWEHYMDQGRFRVEGEYGYKYPPRSTTMHGVYLPNGGYIGAGWINLKNDPAAGYHGESIVEGYQKAGYLKSTGIKLFDKDTKKPGKDTKNEICKGRWNGEVRHTNLYLLYFNDLTGEYAISGYLNFSNRANEEKTRDSYWGDPTRNPGNHWGTCIGYGMNYVVGNT